MPCAVKFCVFSGMGTPMLNHARDEFFPVHHVGSLLVETCKHCPFLFDTETMFP